MNSIERLAEAVSKTIEALKDLPAEECVQEVRLLCALETALNRRAERRAQEIMALWEQCNTLLATRQRPQETVIDFEEEL